MAQQPSATQQDQSRTVWHWVSTKTPSSTWDLFVFFTPPPPNKENRRRRHNTGIPSILCPPLPTPSSVSYFYLAFIPCTAIPLFFIRAQKPRLLFLLLG